MKSALIDLHTRSTRPWKDRSVRAALDKLEPLFPALASSELVRISWQSPYPTQPSAEISLALQSLVGATRQLGIPRDVETSVVRDAVRAFVAQARQLDGWKDLKNEAAVQAAVDLGFLTLLDGGNVGNDEMVLEHLKSVSRPTFRSASE